MELRGKTGRNYPVKRKKTRMLMRCDSVHHAIKKRQVFCLALLPERLAGALFGHTLRLRPARTLILPSE